MMSVTRMRLKNRLIILSSDDRDELSSFSQSNPAKRFVSRVHTFTYIVLIPMIMLIDSGLSTFLSGVVCVALCVRGAL